MYRFTSRLSRMALALALIALGACADQQLPTESAQAPTVGPQLAAGDIYVVTNTNDNGVGSLRWALSYATGGEIIRFDPSLAGQTITLDSTIHTYVPYTIEGPAGMGITLSGGGTARVLFAQHNGVVTLRNLMIRNGRAPKDEDAGAVKSIGDLVLDHVALVGNVADGRSALLATDVTIINSTISGNTSTKSKEAAYLVHATIVNSTIANNAGGGISGSSALTLRNSIIAGNGLNANCDLQYFTVTYEGNNLSDDSSCGGPSDMLIGTTGLAALADNGGPGFTHALLAGSLAIDAGTDCSVTTDGRYFPRDASCDLGAFEFADFTAITVSVDPSVEVNRKTGWAVVTGTVVCTRPESFDLAVDVAQQQKSGKTTVDVSALGTTPVACDTAIRPWSVALAPAVGGFQTGSATATASTSNTPAWATPASVSRAVKLFQGRP
ncbi:MAG TPA: right-handed parallel beta-helix repeat-containing protein [Gemmatimonadaceae bacterium]|nr:right-handed parallel beta-helix repeat-containing protein [Gemmatimonadaceae bacterium]